MSRFSEFVTEFKVRIGSVGSKCLSLGHEQPFDVLFGQFPYILRTLRGVGCPTNASLEAKAIGEFLPCTKLVLATILRLTLAQGVPRVKKKRWFRSCQSVVLNTASPKNEYVRVSTSASPSPSDP